ncbi:hypothetical protein P154DRAFT_538424 [Amniculicola lignicola CBS 123094]|uniref:Uncharacterized protein n=1 Tax=Amniculicola lignicola CBS 123094 TaxID=1392246 RepID=A0A6A5W6Z8_9PLEO|nr:hypothetical protein P154DRAFT_538424 [Amniculicola lignicola CBS 123094]
MKLTIFSLLPLLPAICAAIQIPRGTTSAAINLPQSSDLRIYHQSSLSLGIHEVSVGTPARVPIADSLIWGGPTRQNTPLAAITYSEEGQNTPEIRVYYITPKNTLGELAYFKGKWNNGADLGFPVLADSQALYALRVGFVIIVGYTNGQGDLAEAYYDTASPVWRTYTL